MSIEKVSYLKSTFYKNLSKVGGAQAQAIKESSKTNVVVCSDTQKNGRLYGFMDETKFINSLDSNKGLYEIITRYPHKVYFDIDDATNTVSLEQCKSLILNTFPNASMAISGSITTNNNECKTSFHIILNNYLICNDADRTYIAVWAKQQQYFDEKVYSKNRLMKCINQSKRDGRIQEIIENPDYKQHCITCFIEPHSLILPKLTNEMFTEVMIQKSKKLFNLGCLPKLKKETDKDYYNLTREDILQLLPVGPSYSYDYMHLVARFCYHNGGSWNEYINWIGCIENENGRRQWDELLRFPPISFDCIKLVVAHFYPNIKKDKSYRDFVNTFELPKEMIVPIETIDQTCFKNPEKYSIFNVGMGGGKTAQTITYLSQCYSFCWIAPNKALANNTQFRLNTENVDSFHYESMNTKDKSAGKLIEKNKLIICLNSIHYIPKEKVYDTIVIDEIETLLDKFYGTFMNDKIKTRKKENWETFTNIIKNARKVILLDAFITTKTLNFIKSLEFAQVPSIYSRINEPQTRTIKYMDDVEAMIHNIICKIQNGSKIFIFYPYKKDSGKFHSMEKVFNLIKEQTGKNGIFYNADIDDVVKVGLKNVNESWGDAKFIITNNIITCGVNYEKLDFDYKYLFIASFNTPRDIIQVSYRARYLSTGIIKVCYMGKMNETNCWVDDCAEIQSASYSNLYNTILIEKKAPIKRSFQLFCVKAHYKQSTDDYKISAILKKEVNDALEKQQLGYSYETIDDINYGDAEHIVELCFAQSATMYQKIQLQKYYYQLQFVDKEHEFVQRAWDDNFFFFFKQLKLIMPDEFNIFNKIATYNKLNSLFPFDIKKTKLTPDIIEDIFKQFTFKTICKTSSHYKILKEIYNTFFSKMIVKTEYDNNNHQNVNYSIDEDVHEYYEWAKSNLILSSDNLVNQPLFNMMDYEAIEKNSEPEF